MGDRANFLPTNSAIAYLLNYAVIVQEGVHKAQDSSNGYGSDHFSNKVDRCEGKP
jgi:hypothetical protein